MTAYVDGDRHAFAVLFARLAPRIHGFFRRSFDDRATADDLLQATFLQIHCARERYQRDLPLKPWIFTIAARVRLSELRKRYRRPDLVRDEELDEAADSPSAEAALESADRAASVQRAIDRLPQSQRVVIHLNRFEDMTFAEIATVLGTTEGAIKLKAFRAYQSLRASLEKLERETVKTS